jgi:hypothetical protein
MLPPSRLRQLSSHSGSETAHGLTIESISPEFRSEGSKKKCAAPAGGALRWINWDVDIELSR